MEQFNRVVEDMKSSNGKVFHEQAQQLMLGFSELGIGLPRGASDNHSAELFMKLVDKAAKRRLDSVQVLDKFRDAFKRLTSLRANEVNRASVAGLTEGQCKQALVLASDRKKHEMAKMEVEQQELIARAEKAAKESEALRMELEKLRTRTSKDDREAAGLRRLLAQADVDLCSLRASNIELTEKVTDLEEQLTKWIAYGRDASGKTEELEEKLRCSICMDQPKNTVFACGHTCCGQCASEWKKCYYNCASERRQKPVKYSFPIYL
ncbi:hypothetical protein AAVH_24087 [Aphelenchoides avenae]|nr:hypothetical protein AAVH_24087 [Aphelenchus avenae]